MIDIATRGDLPSALQLVQLDGVTYALSLTWAVRGASYFVAIFDETGETLLASGRLIVDWPMFTRREHRGTLPPGALVFVETSGSGLPPIATEVRRTDGREVFSSDLGTRVILSYFTAADLAEE